MEYLSIQLKFQTESSYINADTLIKVMKEYVSLIKESNKELESLPIIINVDAFSEGSFIVNFKIKLKEYLSSPNITYLSNIAAIIGVAFAIYNSNDVKSIDNSITINNNIIKIENNQIAHINENQNINKNITNIYKNIMADGHINGIETFIDDALISSVPTKTMMSVIPRTTHKVQSNFAIDTLKEDTSKSFHFNLLQKTEKLENIPLEIIDFPKDLFGMWTFLYNGIIIKAEVDENTLSNSIYMIKVEKGETVNSDIEITKEWSPQYNVFTNKEYKIFRFN